MNNEICNVFILDTPDFCNWLRGGELVLGNGYVFHNQPEEFPVFLRNLAVKSAAALGMKFERYRFAHNYDEIIQLADRFDFPLIEIPFNYTWNMVIEEIYKKSNILPSRSMINNADLLSIIEERMDPLDLAYSLHARIKREIFVYSNKLQLCHHIDSKNENSHDPAAIFRRTAVMERMHPHNLGGIAINTQSKIINGHAQKYASYRICNIEICVRLNGKENMLPTSHEKPVINTLLLFYLMVMDDVLIISSEKQKLQSLLERILTGRHSDPEIMLSQFAGLRIQFPLPCVLLILYLGNAPAIHRETQPFTRIHCLMGEQMILIMSPRELRERFDDIRAFSDTNNIFGVYSNTVESIDGLPGAFSEARENLAWLNAFSAKGLYSLNDVLLKISLSKFFELEESSAILKNYWNPLKKSQKKLAIPLDKIASSLIDANFNLSKTAVCLNVHYNTMRNYLAELENTLNVSFEDPEARFLLTLARGLDNLTADGDPVNRETR